MTRRLPIVATVVVLAAVAVMIALGFWQLERKAEKQALLATYAAAGRSRAAVPWPSGAQDFAAALYRPSRVRCDVVRDIRAVAGRSRTGRAGWAQIATCTLSSGGTGDIALGWSPRPERPRWIGGEVAGIIAPAGKGIRLVADPPQAGLDRLAAPDPASIPNNHLSYAVQWFAFAATALAIYGLALRRRSRGG